MQNKKILDSKVNQFLSQSRTVVGKSIVSLSDLGCSGFNRGNHIIRTREINTKQRGQLRTTRLFEK